MKKGFTLIELIMVIVIIGILAAIAIPKFTDLQDDARAAACKSDVATIRTALANFYARYNLDGACPTGATCDASGFPAASELEGDDTTFADSYFADESLPDTGHITATGTHDWADYYTPSAGTMDIDSACP